MPPNNRSLLINRPGAGGTFESITLKSTILGILIPGAIVAAMRLFVAFAFVAVTLAVGKHAGGLLGCGVALYVLVQAHVNQQYEFPGIAWRLVGLGFVLTLLSVFEYWPVELLDWSMTEGQLYVRWLGEWYITTPTIVGLRLFAIFGMPFVAWVPYRVVTAAFIDEIKWPKLRESQIATVDPESISDEAKPFRSSATPQPREVARETVTIPAPTVEGE